MANATVEEKLAGVEVRLARLEGTVEARERDLPSRLDRVEARLDGMDRRLDTIESRLAGMENLLHRMEQRLTHVEGRLDRLEQNIFRIPYFILASWLTIMLTLIGGLYFRG
jgi:predicted nuclease with TOPRIM domain